MSIKEAVAGLATGLSDLSFDGVWSGIKSAPGTVVGKLFDGIEYSYKSVTYANAKTVYDYTLNYGGYADASLNAIKPYGEAFITNVEPYYTSAVGTIWALKDKAFTSVAPGLAAVDEKIAAYEPDETVRNAAYIGVLSALTLFAVAKCCCCCRSCRRLQPPVSQSTVEYRSTDESEPIIKMTSRIFFSGPQAETNRQLYMRTLQPAPMEGQEWRYMGKNPQGQDVFGLFST